MRQPSGGGGGRDGGHGKGIEFGGLVCTGMTAHAKNADTVESLTDETQQLIGTAPIACGDARDLFVGRRWCVGSM
jgi:hypothetical protein